MPMKSSHESSLKAFDESPRLLKVDAVARRLNNSPSTIYALIESGELEHYRCPGIRISEEQLARYLTASQRGGRAERQKRPARRPKLSHIRLP